MLLEIKLKKVGLSYSRCLIDLVEEDVDYEEVLVIVTGTFFNPHDDDQWKSIWNGYKNSSWRSYNDKEELFRAKTLELYDDGKLHQPRTFGGHHRSRSYHWLKCMPDVNYDHPAIKDAHDKLMEIIELVN